MTAHEPDNERLRRYYLGQMGIQCWDPVDKAALTGAGPVAAESAAAIPPANTGLNLEQAVQACTACRLHETRKQALTGRGNSQADIILLLSHPAAEDDRDGLLCSGAPGELLEKMLAAIGLDLGQVLLTSLLKCMVPERHTISPAEVVACSSHLYQQVALTAPRHLVVLGEIAAQCLLQRDQPIDTLRETINNSSGEPVSYGDSDVFGDIGLLVSYSPMELMAHPENKRKAWQDLQLLQSRLAADAENGHDTI